MRASRQIVSTLIIAAGAIMGIGQSAGFAADRCAAGSGGPQPSDFVLPAQSSPFIFRVLGDTIYPVAGTDGLIHLAYVAQVTNATVAPGKNFRVVPVDPLANFQPTGRNFVQDVDGPVITGLIAPFSKTPQDVDLPITTPTQPVYSDRLRPGASGVSFFDVTYTDLAAVPSLLSHQLFVHLDEHGLMDHTALTTPIAVSCRDPVVLSPPLVGSGWFDANGCCAVVNGHRASASGLHLNGDLRAAEQFGVDWLQIDAHGRCCNGDLALLQSWEYYGAPIYAAASGTVFSVIARDQPDQEPVGTVRDITLQNLTGNSLIEDIGGGRYMLYAHMKPGSIPATIQDGTHVEVGQMIGRLGNSGNSDAPHLHFQVTDSPSALVATGLPFVFNKLAVQGRIIGVEGPVVDDYLAGKPVPLDTSGNGSQQQKMPLSSTVFGF
jgi:hypothetical protein